MQFETFRGRTVEEAVAAVKAALGPDALIGSTRRITNERSGKLETSFVEVTAAPAPRSPTQKLRMFSRDFLDQGDRSALGRAPRSAALRPTRGTFVEAGNRSSDKEVDVDIRSELGAIRSLLEEVISSSKPTRSRATALLKAARIEGKLAARLVAGSSRLPSSKGDLREWLRQRISDRLNILPSPIEQPGPRLVVCVGSTGVGKTTTVAKLAARAHLDLGRSVSIISLDTFRVGSIEQMRRFGDLIGVSFDVATDRASFQRVLAVRNPDIAFVDTASLPPSNVAAVRRLNECLQAVEGREKDVLLIVPAGIHPEDAERLAGAYRNPEPTGVVITKVDEAVQIGGAMHAILPRPMPVAYMCDGPRVPEDIHVATTEMLLDAVLPMSEKHAD